MFTHCDTEQSEYGSVSSAGTLSDHQLCAITKMTRDVQLEALKGHLKELAKFSEAELIAAIEDTQEPGSIAQGSYTPGGADMSVDDESDSEEEEEDDEKEGATEFDDEPTMAQVIKKLRQEALAKKKAQEKKTKEKKAKGKTTGQRLNDIKFMLPFLEAMMLKRNLRGLLLNYAVDYAF